MRFEDRHDLLKPGYLPMETGVEIRPDGTGTVAAFTRMPRCRAKMIDWWFSWVGDTDQYKLWHPRDHVASAWEGRVDGKYIGATHLAVEYMAGQGPVKKLRISFKDPREFFDAAAYDASNVFAVCGRVGPQDHPFVVSHLCHSVRDTDYGCEMRSRFWQGHIASTDPDKQLSEQ